MTCYHPLQGWKSKDLTARGKRAVVFSPDKGFVDLPVQVPCGQCIGCRLEKARQWALRLMHEAQFHDYRWFLTLTYSDEHYPERGSLDKSHFQKFMKRLRKANPGCNIRYMHCGEYGDETFRPHYHAIVFGLPIPDLRQYEVTKRGDTMWTSEKLDQVWGLGKVMIGSVSYESAGYVARYVLKKVTGEQATDFYRRVDPETGEVFSLVPPYVTMSLKPAIGDRFYDEFQADMAGDFCIANGHEVGLPKRYDRRIEADDPEGLTKRKLARRKKAAGRKADNTPERLAVREEVKLAQLRALNRS